MDKTLRHGRPTCTMDLGKHAEQMRPARLLHGQVHDGQVLGGHVLNGTRVAWPYMNPIV